MLGGVVRKVHLFKSDLEIEKLIRPAFCHSGTGTVGGNEEKQKAEMKKKWIYISRSTGFYSNIKFLSKIAYCRFCTQVNKQSFILVHCANMRKELQFIQRS